MSGSNNPFVVPEEFFPAAKESILASASRIRRRRIGIAASLAVLFAVAVPAYLGFRPTAEPDLYVEAADLYDYDLVLQLMD